MDIRAPGAHADFGVAGLPTHDEVDDRTAIGRSDLPEPVFERRAVGGEVVHRVSLPYRRDSRSDGVPAARRERAPPAGGFQGGLFSPNAIDPERAALEVDVDLVELGQVGARR